MKIKSVLIASILIAISSASTAQVKSRPDWHIPLGVEVEWVDGYPIAYQEYGQGDTIVLVHGSMGDYRTWAGQVPTLSRHYRVFTLSLPRYYPEKWNGQGDRFGVVEHAKAVSDFIKAKELGTVYIIGHSRGGAVAIKIASLHPEVIRTLIIADASGMENLLPDTPESQRLLEQSRHLRKNLIEAIQRGEAEKGAEAFTDSLGVPGTWRSRTPEQRAAFMDNLGTAIGDSGPRPTTRCEDIASFGFPVLLIHGARSPGRYAAMGDAARRCNSSIGEAVTIPSAAHSMNRENPTAFNLAVLNFLNSLARAK
jgi:pimeloyl-ACP methyl ester carboxylesterase